MAVLVLMTIIHFRMFRKYPHRISQLGMEVAETESDVNRGNELGDALADGVRMLAQAKADRANSYYAFVIGVMCVVGLSVPVALHHLAGTEPVGWMSLLFLPLPALMLLYHIYNTRAFFAKRR